MTVWMSAWLHGTSAADDVLDALGIWAPAHEVVAADHATAGLLNLPGPEDRPDSPAMLLATVRRSGARSARLILPRPGAPGATGTMPGVAGPNRFGAAAMRAGQGVVLPGADLGMVPEPVAEDVLRWTVHRVSAGADADYAGLSDAEHSLRTAVREAATTLSSLDIARHRPEVRAEIADTLAARPAPPWPNGTPARVLRVLEHADEVTAILAAAAGDEGNAATSAESQARASALRPLAAAVCAARLAAVAEAVRALTDDRCAGRH